MENSDARARLERLADYYEHNFSAGKADADAIRAVLRELAAAKAQSDAAWKLISETHAILCPYSSKQRDVLKYAKKVIKELDAAKAVVERLREAIDKIVVSEGIDAGVVLLSNESPTHYDPEVKCQAYDHENFSPLGDALVALAKMARGEAAQAKETDR